LFLWQPFIYNLSSNVYLVVSFLISYVKKIISVNTF
jgi:hypothetical protein